MSRSTGRGADIWLDQSSDATGQATPLRYSNKWTLSGSTEFHDVTAFGDLNKVQNPDLPDASGTISGFADDTVTTGSTNLFRFAQGGLARKCYMYSTTPSATGPLFMGKVYIAADYEVDVAGPNTFSVSWAAATAITPVG